MGSIKVKSGSTYVKHTTESALPLQLSRPVVLDNKKLCRAFSRQANRHILNIPVLQDLLRVNRKAEKMRKVDRFKIMNYKF